MCSPIRFTRPGAKALLPCGFMDATLGPEGASMDTWRRARRGDRAYVRQVIGERRAVQAFLRRSPSAAAPSRWSSASRPPRATPAPAGRCSCRRWWSCGSRSARWPSACAASSRSAASLRSRASSRARGGLPGGRPRGGADPEAGLWRLFAHPPRPRLARGLSTRLPRQPHVQVVVVVGQRLHTRPAGRGGPCSAQRRSARRPPPGSGSRAPVRARGRSCRRARRPLGRRRAGSNVGVEAVLVARVADVPYAA